MNPCEMCDNKYAALPCYKCLEKYFRSGFEVCFNCRTMIFEYIIFMAHVRGDCYKIKCCHGCSKKLKEGVVPVKKEKGEF